jgi:maltose/maltodextrin transport system permease protein
MIIWERWLKWSVTAGVAAATLWLVFGMYTAGQPAWALGVLALVSLAFFIYLSDMAFAYRYLFPGVAGMLLFVAFPLFYTAQIGFTNYSSSNLLSLERATAYLLEQTLAGESRTMDFTLHADGNEFRLVLTSQHDQEDEKGRGKSHAQRERSFVSPPLALLSTHKPVHAAMSPLTQGSVASGVPLPLSEVIAHRSALMQLRLELPDHILLSYAGVSEFAPLNKVWKKNPDDTLTQMETNTVYQPNHQTGFFENGAGERVQPGFKVNIGFGNYARMLMDPDFRGPFLAIFIWTVVFAGLTVLLTTAIGISLAVMLNWESLRFRTLYRTLLFLPYAVPGFISILVFKGLFNQNFGEINMILNTLFGIKPAWFADPLLAQTMILIVNTWLGYPYIMILCSGLIKTIPPDLYEASAIAGAKPLTNFFRITAPLIIKPLTPLLISIFAFNFNNFVLIALLTDGRPDFLNTKLPAGTTDILVSYTYRIAFKDSGQNFGLAAAISTVIFFMVTLLSLANLRLARVNQGNK